MERPDIFSPESSRLIRVENCNATKTYNADFENIWQHGFKAKSKAFGDVTCGITQ